MPRRKLAPIHPGEILLDEFLVPSGISQYRLAKDISVPPRRINEIVRGQRSITADTALRLARFFRTSETGEVVRYRLLCLSRNLTFDRSWDTVLLLDGVRTDRKKGFSQNRTLADFIEGLPSFASREEGVGPQAERDTARIAQELRVVQWDLPEGIDELRFWPLGMGGKGGWPFPKRMDGLLVVAPYVTDEFLERVNEGGQHRFLVSRPDSLQALRATTLADKWRCFTLEDGLEVGSSRAEDASEPSELDTLSGLHAKVFIADAGWNAHVWTGSANATTAAFGGNVEFLVEMIGKKSKLGIDATIGEDIHSANLRSMLAEFTPDAETVAPDKDGLEADARIEAVREAITSLPLVIRIKGDAVEGAGLISTVECTDLLTAPDGVTVRCRPVMLPPTEAKIVESGKPVQVCFGPHAPESISSFVAFEAVAKVGSAEHAAQFVLNLPLIGAPSDRKEQLLHNLLKDTRTLLRFLMLLLSDDPEHLFDELRNLAKTSETDRSRRSEDLVPLLEHLLRALHRSPGKLEQVHRLIEDLRKTPEGRSILPCELDSVWEPINRARNASIAATDGPGGAK